MRCSPLNRALCILNPISLTIICNKVGYNRYVLDKWRLYQLSNPYETNYGYEKSSREQTCHCGAVFHVSVPGQKGHEEPEEYYCPECHCEYKARASMSPTVTLISGRTDGKTGSC